MHPKTSFRHLLLLMTTLAWGGWIPHPVLPAADFVMESTVRELNSPNEPRNLVVLLQQEMAFHQEMAFESSRNAPHQGTVVDFQRENIWRLDQQWQTKERLTLQDLLRLTKEATQRATGLGSLLRFAPVPRFTSREWFAERAELVLEHPLLTYRARLSEFYVWMDRFPESIWSPNQGSRSR